MQSDVKFFFFKPRVEPNKELEAYLQKVAGWEIVSVSLKISHGVGIYVAIAFRAIGKGGMKTSKLEAPTFIS